MWLMLRDSTVEAGKRPAASAEPSDAVKVGHWNRLTIYDLRKRTWAKHRRLEAYGLIEVIRDEANRRPDGTTRGGIRADPHRFRLTDDGLKKPAVSRVLKELSALRG